MFVLIIMTSGIAYSDVIHSDSKLACTIFSVLKIRVVLINYTTRSIAFSDFVYFMCVKKLFKYFYDYTYHQVCK